MRYLYLTLSSLFLMGCGESEGVWVHTAKDNSGFIQDRDGCNRFIDSGDAGYKEKFTECMEARGWVLEMH